jgi:hypothetical protein
MKNKCHLISVKIILLLITLPFLLNAGCQRHYIASKGTTEKISIKKIILIGFKPAGYQGETPDHTLYFFYGHGVAGGTAMMDKTNYLSSGLFERMLKNKGYDLISPSSAVDILSRIISDQPGIGDLEIIDKIIHELNADAVLIGNLERWKEREGSDYSVNRPASVAFDLRLVIPENGATIWKGRFDKTQKSLSENILDLSLFIKGKGKWLEADDLADLGLDKLADDLFKFIKKGKETEN